MKSWLISEGVNVSRFGTQHRKGNSIPISRRKKRRIVGGEIAFPTEVHTKVLRANASGKASDWGIFDW